ncbi:MAG: WD40 repeat domain-containing protein [Chloroherpetonaceae bacterium]
MSQTRISPVQTFFENKQNAYTVAFAPDSKRFAAAGGLRSVFVYEVGKPEAIGGLADHRQSVYAMLFSKSGKYFITTGRDGMTIVYDAQTFDKLATILSPQLGANYISATYLHDSKREGRVMVSDGKETIEIADITGVYDALHYIFYELNKADSDTAKHGGLIRSVFEKAGKVATEREVVFSNPQLLPNYALALNHDETELYVGASGGALKVFRLSDFSLIRVVPLHAGNIRTIALSPNGELLATGSSDRLVKILDAKTFEVLHTIEGHGDSVFSVMFSPDGKLFITGGKDARLRIWTVEGKSIKPKVKILAHTFSIKAMTFVNGGKELLTVSQDKTIKLWDIQNAQCKETIDRTNGGHTFTINAVSLSPDGRYFVTGSDDKTVKLWEMN